MGALERLAAFLLLLGAGFLGVILGSSTNSVVVADYTKPSNEWLASEVQTIYDSVVQVRNSSGSWGTGWVVSRTESESFVLTAGHCVLARYGWTDPIEISVVFMDRLSPRVTQAQIIAQDTLKWGDIALLRVPHRANSELDLALVDSQPLDSVVVAGIQPFHSPCLITFGAIVANLAESKENCYNAWAWFGMSGGPVIDYRTKRVTSLVSWGPAFDASLTYGPNLARLRLILLDNGVKD